MGASLARRVDGEVGLASNDGSLTAGAGGRDGGVDFKASTGSIGCDNDRRVLLAGGKGGAMEKIFS